MQTKDRELAQAQHGLNHVVIAVVIAVSLQCNCSACHVVCVLTAGG